MSGIHDDAIAYTAQSLKLLRAEIERRTARLKALPREVCPDKRVTRAIGVKRSLKLWPIACVVDECQNLFGHPKYGKQVTRSKKVKARNDHDAKLGDTVRIMETRPVAKTVRWRTVEVILRAK